MQLIIQRHLYSYWRSSAAYRVRIALNLKKLNYNYHAVNLIKNGGEQYGDKYSALNKQQLIPFYCEYAAGKEIIAIGQSQAIIDYLELRYPQLPLLPNELTLRAKILSMAQMIACEIHPLNNLRVLNYLQNNFQLTATQKSNWYEHWIAQGFAAIEKQLQEMLQTQQISSDGKPGYLEVFLIPQIYNAKRFNCCLKNYPLMMQLYENAEKYQEFKAAHPDAQPDRVL